MLGISRVIWRKLKGGMGPKIVCSTGFISEKNSALLPPQYHRRRNGDEADRVCLHGQLREHGPLTLLEVTLGTKIHPASYKEQASKQLPSSDRIWDILLLSFLNLSDMVHVISRKYGAWPAYRMYGTNACFFYILLDDMHACTIPLSFAFWQKYL